jgi:hypothetical protein
MAEKTDKTDKADRTEKAEKSGKGATADKTEKALAEWRLAEERYAQALAGILAEPAGVTLKAALELTGLRSRADARMDRYFKRVLT